MRVLVIDDDGPNRETLANVLANLGHTVDTAVNGLQAMERVAACRPDLMILDMALPLMGGRQLLQRLTVPTIVWSGVVNDEIPGVLAVVEKPHVEKLLAEIAKFGGKS